MALLFLDFDGVLRPVHSDKADYFCLLENFEAVMREFPGVRIVIASTWLLIFTQN
jgi:HAD domain in Swiss Army Knife RNA repair proteins